MYIEGTNQFNAQYSTSPHFSLPLFQDVNNDGFNDVILGESPDSTSTAGAAYVVFGSESFSALNLDVSALDGTNGFKIEGTDAGDFAGTAVCGAGVCGKHELQELAGGNVFRLLIVAAAAAACISLLKKEKSVRVARASFPPSTTSSSPRPS